MRARRQKRVSPRAARLRRQHRQGVIRWTAATCGILAGVYVLAAMSLGGFVADRFILPRQTTPSPPAATATPQPTVTPALAASITEEVSFPELTVYAVSAGDYATIEEAKSASSEVMARGGAGFVRQDGRYYVLTSAYLEEQSANLVAEQITQQNMQGKVHPISTGGIRLKVTAPVHRIDGIRDAFSLWQQAVGDLGTLWERLDAQEINVQEAVGDVKLWAERLEEKRQMAFSGTLIDGEAQALESLDDMLRRSIAYLDTFSDKDNSGVAVSAKIKYTYLACITDYEAYIAALQQQ